jgi:hypothetical protein
VQVFDNALFLTRGNPIGPMALLTNLNPNQYVYTGVLRSRADHLLIVGQMRTRIGDQSARISFLMPEFALGKPAASTLLEALAWEAGNIGAVHLLAEVEERSEVVAPLRRAGFTIYGWQHIWRFSQDQLPKNCQKNCWQPARSQDEIAIKSLYHTLVPPLLQGAEPVNGRSLNGLVYRQDGDILAYAEGQSGPNGVYLSPIIHPDVDDPRQIFHDLLHSLSPRARRPVYIAVRSYQSWFEAAGRTKRRMRPAPGVDD